MIYGSQILLRLWTLLSSIDHQPCTNPQFLIVLTKGKRMYTPSSSTKLYIFCAYKQVSHTHTPSSLSLHLPHKHTCTPTQVCLTCRLTVSNDSIVFFHCSNPHTKQYTLTKDIFFWGLPVIKWGDLEIWNSFVQVSVRI